MAGGGFAGRPGGFWGALRASRFGGFAGRMGLWFLGAPPLAGGQATSDATARAATGTATGNVRVAAFSSCAAGNAGGALRVGILRRAHRFIWLTRVVQYTPSLYLSEQKFDSDTILSVAAASAAEYPARSVVQTTLIFAPTLAVTDPPDVVTALLFDVVS